MSVIACLSSTVDPSYFRSARDSGIDPRGFNDRLPTRSVLRVAWLSRTGQTSRDARNRGFNKRCSYSNLTGLQWAKVLELIAMNRAFSLRVLSLLLVCVLIRPQANASNPVYGRKAMVVAEEERAADVGRDVLRSGGNAVDAAVAVGFALAVTYPVAGNIGGGGFMLIRMADGRTTFIDFREKAPAKATHDMYLDASGKLTDESTIGWRSVGVPGTVRGLELAHKKYGHKPWAELIKPAVDLATNGFPFSDWPMLVYREEASSDLSRFPETKRIFLKGGAFYDWQETFRQPDLGQTLDRIARLGARDFYDGETAHLLAAAMQKNGGLITLSDLHDYQAVERTPLEGDYNGYHIITSPPPSSGGVGLLQMLAILSTTGYEKSGAGSAQSYHYLAEVMRRSFADRNEYLGDPDFVKNPVSSLLDPAYVRARRATINPEHATPSDQVNPGLPAAGEGTDTTHYSIVDEQGNAVAVTYTLNGAFGSGVTVPGAGFLLNNEMDDFAAKPGTPNQFGLVQGERNAIGPGKRPLSSMTPTILLKDNKAFLVLGAPGGPTIITAVLQVIVNVIDFGMNVQEAVDFPRMHHQWKPDRLDVESGISPDTIALLKQMGYPVRHVPGLASVEAILISNGWLQGGHDARAMGKAAGY
jgi:gamma-glutamyltranspeptidase/glutathione hydrolase